MEKRLKVAVIGTGKLGARHAVAYSKMPGIELVGVCDVLESRAREVAAQCKTQVFKDHRKLLGLIDAASIVVPSPAHYEISKDFLSRGVHLLIEKPITTKLSDADKLIAMARAKKAIIQVGHIERFNSAVRKIKEVIKNPRFIECLRMGPYDPRVADTGATLDLMIHDIDIVLDLVRSPIKSVDAVGAFIFSKTEDIANARIRFANHSVCDLTVSRVTQEVTRKTRIFQDNAYIVLDYVKQEASIATKEGGKFHHKKIEILPGDSLRAELEDFKDCIHYKRQPLVSGKEGRDALALGLKITELIKKTQNSIVY